MKVQVAKWGNSTAVRLPKAVVEELKLKPGQTVEVTLEGAVVQLRPLPQRRRITLDEIVAEARRLGPENEPETVEWGPDVGSEIIDDDYSRDSSSHPKAGDIVWVDLDPARGSEQAGKRPALVISEARMHEITRRAIICPITRNVSPWSTKVTLPPGLAASGAVLADQVRSVDREARMSRPFGTVPPETLREVRDIVAALIGLDEDEAAPD